MRHWRTQTETVLALLADCCMDFAIDFDNKLCSLSSEATLEEMQALVEVFGFL
jgi:hypothetical protein